MALDEEKMRTMRGDPEPDPGDPNEAAEGEDEGAEDVAPSEKAIECMRRFRSAFRQGDDRAAIAALHDLIEESY